MWKWWWSFFVPKAIFTFLLPFLVQSPIQTMYGSPSKLGQESLEGRDHTTFIFRSLGTHMEPRAKGSEEEEDLGSKIFDNLGATPLWQPSPKCGKLQPPGNFYLPDPEATWKMSCAKKKRRHIKTCLTFQLWFTSLYAVPSTYIYIMQFLWYDHTLQQWHLRSWFWVPL